MKPQFDANIDDKQIVSHDIQIERDIERKNGWNEWMNDQLLLCSILTLHNHSVYLYVHTHTHTHTRRAFTIDTYIPALFSPSLSLPRTHNDDDDEGCVSRQTSKRIDSIKRHKLQTWSIVIVPERMINWTVLSAVCCIQTTTMSMSRLTNPIVRSMKNLLIKPVLHLHLKRDMDVIDKCMKIRKWSGAFGMRGGWNVVFSPKQQDIKKNRDHH